MRNRAWITGYVDPGRARSGHAPWGNSGIGTVTLSHEQKVQTHCHVTVQMDTEL